MHHNNLNDLEEIQDLSYLSSENMAYIDSLYDDYLHDPLSVSLDWRQIFAEKMAVSSTTSQNLSSTNGCNKYDQITSLINAYRSYGHHIANLDPLGMTKHVSVPSLELGYHGLTMADLDSAVIYNNYFDGTGMTLKAIYQALQDVYCDSIGIEYMYIADAEVLWLQKYLEAQRPPMQPAIQLSILKQLIAADSLERYLGSRFVGQKRFSLEGGDALIPMLKLLLNQAGQSNVREVLIGMAHRGRLNVLVNVLGKEPDALFQEFEGKSKIANHLTGDVKYHMGFSSDIRAANGNIVHVALAFNPSHLEIIGPVVEGAVRSRLGLYNDLAAKNVVIPLIIHGDAAFSGQGVVMETFNFSQSRGYATGGTIHVVINNQIGFTTSNPADARSTLYCTDIAKMIQAPIFHVNADDPEAVLFVTQLAFEFRMQFKRDVVIDLVCYRRNGHNEADEPAITQPVMYKKIKSLPTAQALYARKLIAAGLVTESQVQQFIDDYRNCLDTGRAVVETIHDDYPGKLVHDWHLYINAQWTDPVDTTVSLALLQELSVTLQHLPSGFTLHPVVKKLVQDRKNMTGGDKALNWGYAEIMAYATLLHDGYEIRLSGQDSGRGTFVHRHAVFHDIATGDTYTPLEYIATPQQKKLFVVIDSVLSEEAVLAFEYGYAAADPKALVIWEAQFGDFANGSQVVIDQFISSGEQKWGRLCGLVMFLPHGYEGQGPEHSSARLERFMQLCAQNNMQVCTPTTPAQIFHLLRRQMLRKFRKPLIVMTPKSLLRHKLAVSSLADLTSGSFQLVIDEIDSYVAKDITQVILCCGKVYYDLLQKRREQQLHSVVIIRIEQLYPFPAMVLSSILKQYPQAKKIIWCQEEPKNQGAWFSVQYNIAECLQKTQQLIYVGRESAAAPAVGSAALHAQQQQELVEQAFKFKEHYVS